MLCPACSREVESEAPFCDHCGAAMLRMPPPGAASQVVSEGRRRRLLPRVLGALALLVIGGFGVNRWMTPPEVTATALHAAMTHAIANGIAPGQDPICVANGLAYDQEPVNVQLDNSVTLAWMNMLVEAGLYAGPENGSSGGSTSEPISVYRPLPQLAQWGGARRLCVAKAVRLDTVSNLGPVEDMRLRGKRYTGVLADVRWSLDQPAPWLAQPGVGEALARELPSWRSARWQPGPEGWTLTQRKSFVLVDAQWMSSDTVERDRSVPVRNGTTPM